MMDVGNYKSQTKYHIEDKRCFEYLQNLKRFHILPALFEVIDTAVSSFICCFQNISTYYQEHYQNTYVNMDSTT